MNTDTVPMEVLNQLPIFDGMTEVERQQLVDIASTMTCEPGEVVMRQGKSSQNVLVLLEGKCQVFTVTGGTTPAEVLLADLKEFDHFGEMSFFESAPHSASVRALTPVKLLRIERSDYDLLIKDGNLAAYKLAYNMVGRLVTRLRRMDHWVTELLGKEPTDSKDAKISEWNRFRDKLFSNWDL